MARYIKKTWMILLLLALNMCGIQTSVFNPIPNPYNLDTAEAVIINPSSPAGYPWANIALDGIAILYVAKGEFTIVQVPSGEHLLSIYEEPQFSKTTNFKAGNRYYFVVKHGYLKDALLLFERSQAIGWMAKCKYVAVDNSIRLEEIYFNEYGK